MYLAQQKTPSGETRFYIRESYQDDEGHWLTRELFDLGTDPELYIVYEGSRAYYFHPEVEDALDAQGVEYTDDELEQIFWPFLDPDIRRVIEDFGGRRRRSKGPTRWNRKKLAELQKGLHPFDVRRLCFLRFCQIDLESLLRRPLPFLNKLLNKSRDEIEQMIGFMELDLKPFFMRGYLYTIFDLPRRFAPRMTRFIPEQQDDDLLDRYFLEEICLLDSDVDYITSGAVPSHSEALHPYLQKYLFWYFDVFYKEPWMGHGASDAAAAYSVGSTFKEHLKTMGLSPEEFHRMTEEELKSLFRRKAQLVHPDKGGDHESFIALQRAYVILLKRKMMQA